jgi:DNA-binding NtrC family response regulator
MARKRWRSLSRGEYPLVISDIFMPRMDGMELLREVRQRCPQTLVVLITGHGDVKNAVEALRNGAYDYLLKPVNVRELKLLLDRAEEYLELRRTNRRLTEHFHDEVQKATQPLRRRLNELSASYMPSSGSRSGHLLARVPRCSTLPPAVPQSAYPRAHYGETGTGKEVVLGPSTLARVRM